MAQALAAPDAPDYLQQMPDYSYAGYGFGIAPVPEVSGAHIDVTRHGAIADDGLDDSKAVLAALEAAHNSQGPVVLYFPAGRFQITEVLRIERSDIVIRGAGMGDGGTELFFPRPLAMTDRSDTLNELRNYLVKHDKRQREPEHNIDEPFSAYSWSGGYLWVQHPGTRAVSYLPELDKPATELGRITQGERGNQRIQLAPGHQIKAGDVVQVQWRNELGENARLLKEIYGDTELAIGSHHWTFPERPLVSQPTRVVSVSGNEATLGDPLLHPVNEGVPAEVSHWPHLERVGIEDLHLVFPDAPVFGHHLEQGYNGIFLTSAFDSWVRSVRVSQADSALIAENSASVTVSNLQSLGTRMAHYAVYLGSVHNVLVEDLLAANPTVHTFSVNTRCTRCVYLRGVGHRQPTLDQHAGANHQNLFDQTTVYVRADNDDEGPYYRLWDGSGAPYWQPGHGRLNTHWNTTVNVIGGAARDREVRLLGEDEGPGAFVVGVQGNRQFRVDYRPQPVTDFINEKTPFPSLYEYQRNLRQGDTQ